LLIGVDEVGRGPLAGPVVAAAVVFAPDTPRVRGLRDSKVLSAKQRERLAVRIRERASYLGVGAASTREIDRYNIRVATAVAMRRAVARLISGAAGQQGSVRSSRAGALPPHRLTALPTRFGVLIDGLPLPEVGFDHDALVDGDALCYSIAAAGVIAKCVRDRLMVSLHGRHPAYGWRTNMGYGTEEHRAAIDAVGPTRHHRNSFSPVAQLGLFSGTGAGSREPEALG